MAQNYVEYVQEQKREQAARERASSAAMLAALKVITLDPFLSELLKRVDPKALKQAQTAIKLAEGV